MKLLLSFVVCFLLFIQLSLQLPVKQEEDGTKIGNYKEKRELFIHQYCELVKAGKGDINLCLDLLKQRDNSISNIIGNIFGKRSIPLPNSDGLKFIDKNSKNVPKINNNEITGKQKRDFWSKLRDKVTDKLIDNIGKRSIPSEGAADNSPKDQSIDKIGKNLMNAANDEIAKKQKRDFWSKSRDKILGGILG